MGQAASALPPEQLGTLNNSNFRQMAPAAHGAAQQLMQQQAASVCQGIGALPPATSGRQCTGKVVLLEGPNGTLRNAGISVEAKLGVTHEPAKLVEKMPHPGVWERAFLETLRAMARRGLVTLETLPRWQVHFAAWQALSEQFQLLKNWGGFLAANHKVWMAMWERGLPPDADGGRVDVCLVMPYLLWRPQQHGSGGSGSGGSGGSGGGAPGKAGAGGKVSGTFPKS
ncbi:hypothetical protein OEZ85_006518 [Tetradesmus obliquus]|uniref:Uncharacterized protein n=1 Tax=Tetradesmus obliquus TaxID=3088 RepID=A0ABY8TUT7_TETOB|nr:hypothetical protein OEZ85_006518 [Tetradesmus obliquus]